jgi:hypothetical protein
VVAEAAAAAVSEGRGEQTGLNFEANGVGEVKGFPAELKALRLTPGHGPALRNSEVDAEEAVAADDIALSRLSGISRGEGTERSGTIDENIGSACVEEGAGFDGSNEVGVTFLFEVCRDIAIAIVNVDG